MLIVDSSVGEISDRQLAAFERLAGSVRATPRTHVEATGSFLMTRRPDGDVELRRTAARVAPEFTPRPAPTIEQIGPALWRELEAGADTPDGRALLARGMMRKLPCGTCRTHWQEALARMTAADTESAAAFSRFIWSEHNWVRRRQGKREMSWEKYAQKNN